MTVDADERDEGGERDETDAPEPMAMLRVRVLEDVGEILGADEQEYDLAAGDVVDLPATNASTLVDRGAATVLFSGPPEPICLPEQDGAESETVVLAPNGDDVDEICLNQWQCQRCGATTPTEPEDSFLAQPTECEGCERQGPFTHKGLTEAELNDARLAGDLWTAPAGIDETGFGEIWDDVRKFLRDHWDSEDGEIYDMLTAWVATTWVRPNLEFVPHFMLRGATTGGKTRLLNAVSNVSYRGMLSGDITAASLFRSIDNHGVTALISEYHGLDPDDRRAVNQVIRSGQKRGEKIHRAEQTGTGYVPKVWDPFSHMAVATQYEPPDDVINRSVQVRSAPADRDMPALIDSKPAAELRQRLLYARFRLLNSVEWETAMSRSFDLLEERNIDGRTREKLVSLLAVADIWDKLDAMDPVIELVAKQDKEAKVESEDAQFVQVVRDLALERVGDQQFIGDGDPFAAITLSYDRISEEFERVTGQEKSNSWVGQLCSRHGIETARKRDGTVIEDPDLGPTLRDKCKDLGLNWESSEATDPAPELPDDDKGPAASGCPECGTDTTLTHKDLSTGRRICEQCAGEIRAGQS